MNRGQETNLSDQASARFLQAAIVTLRREIVPTLTTPQAQISADLLSRVLYMLHHRFSQRGADLEKLIADDAAIAAEISALLPPPTPSGSAPVAQPAGDADFSAIERLERRVFADEIRIGDKIPQLIALAQGQGPSKSAAVTTLRKIVATQTHFLAAQDPDILKGSAVCYQGGRMTEERPLTRPSAYGEEIDDTTLTRQVQNRFPGAHVEGVTPLAGGFSKSTLFFTLVHPSGQRESLVIRKDLPVDYISSVSFEYPLLRHLHDAGLPVAEPVWLHDDPRTFGGRFMVSRRVAGTTDVSRWAGDPQAVDGFARQMAQVMARLHALPLAPLGYPAAVSKQSAGMLTRKEIERWYQVYRSQRREALPIQEMAMAWLESNVPESSFSRPARLVHGDIGFHNLMIDDGRVTALLDWEFAHAGDPIEDLVYIKPFIEKVMSWDTFKSYYREFGGAACSAQEELFYSIWSKTRNPAVAVQGAAVYVDTLPHDIKFATVGFILARYLLPEVGQMILDTLDS